MELRNETNQTAEKGTTRIMDNGYSQGRFAQIQADQPERRRSIRFPLQMQVSFRPNSKSGSWIAGRTLNISSTGILVQPASDLPRGQKIQMMVDWPQMLDGKIPLRLMVQGRVVRSTSDEAAIHFDRFEFRTAKEPMSGPAGAA